MPKPIPKAEIIVEQREDMLVVYTATPDAVSFIEREAPKYDSLIRLSAGKSYWVYISPIYDLHEVAEYFRKME